MKLYGNKRQSSGGKKHTMTGLQKGLLLLALFVAVLGGTVGVFFLTFVRPMDVDREKPSEEPVPQEEVFVPPTVVEVTTEVDEETGEETQVEIEVPASHKEDFYNILLLGTDDDGTRTDTIMIGRMDVKNHTVALLSVPRDTLISGTYTVPKINSVYGGAGKGVQGIEALQRKLAQTLGFETDGYVMVNLKAFIELVDLVGGVEFDVPMKMDYEDSSQDLYIHLEPGLQLLDGYNAMGLVRFRKGYATQDIERTHVQQRFLQALAKKCLSIGNLSKVNEFAKIFADNVTTDLTLGNLVYFGQELLKCDFETMFTYTLEGEAVMIDHISYYAIYQNKTLQVVNEQFNPYETEITSANVSIRTPEQVYAELAEQEAEEQAQQEEQPPEDPWADVEILPGEDPFAEDPWLHPSQPEEDPWITEYPTEPELPQEPEVQDPWLNP